MGNNSEWATTPDGQQPRMALNSTERHRATERVPSRLVLTAFVAMTLPSKLLAVTTLCAMLMMVEPVPPLPARGLLLPPSSPSPVSTSVSAWESGLTVRPNWPMRSSTHPAERRASASWSQHSSIVSTKHVIPWSEEDKRIRCFITTIAASVNAL